MPRPTILRIAAVLLLLLATGLIWVTVNAGVAAPALTAGGFVVIALVLLSLAKS